MICVILCGGVGSRLWPLSRDMHPKPFFRLADGASLIQHSIRTAAEMPGTREILIVSNAKLRANVVVEVNTAKVSVPVRAIYEPVGRNTAAAVCMAALDVSRRHGPDEPVLVLAADHLIGDVGALGAAVASAQRLACGEGRLVTFGIKPTRAETGYGYIRYEGDRVLEFVEKPSLDAARSYIEDGGYLWNSGMFCFKAGAILGEMAKHSPDIREAVENCYDASLSKASGNELPLDGETFRRAPSDSIDYAVMEKSDNLAIVACDIGWNDIGSWRSFCELFPAMANGNRVIGDCDAFYIGSRNCAIHASGKVVAVIGMADTLVVDTDDALLVTTYDRSQEVRQVYESLKKRKHETSVIHKSVKPPWGEFTVLHAGDGFKVKRLLVLPGKSISLQSHSRRNETWTIVRGRGTVLRADESLPVKPGDTVFIPTGAKHRVECSGGEPLEIIEVQMGDYLGEDDIVRYQDAYGR